MNATATIENVGAIEHIEVPKIEGGGIVVFTGRNGSGKSTAIKAVDALLSGNAKSLQTRDGEPIGFVEGWGAKITVGKRTRRTGEIEVTALESKIDPSSLVDPGIKDQEVADQHRIKALVSLAGIKPDVSLFYEAFGTKELFDSTVKASAISAEDLLSMAGAVKRDAESAARTHESKAEELAFSAKAKFEKPEGVDDNTPSDKHKLDADLETAVRNLALLESTRAAALQTIADALEAEDKLADLGQADSVMDCDEEIVNRTKSLKDANDALANAQLLVVQAEADLATAKRKKAWAIDNNKTRSALSALIERGKSVTCPDTDSIDKARAVVSAAREAVALGQRAREYAARKKDAEEIATKSLELRKLADSLRRAAAATSEVLTVAVQKAGIPELRVAAGRLVTKTRRGETLFCELSEGERWRIAIDLAIRHVGPGGVFTIPQIAWESVDGDNRRAINNQVKASKVTVITAEATKVEDYSAGLGVTVWN